MEAMYKLVLLFSPRKLICNISVLCIFCGIPTPFVPVVPRAAARGKNTIEIQQNFIHQNDLLYYLFTVIFAYF